MFFRVNNSVPDISPNRHKTYLHISSRTVLHCSLVASNQKTTFACNHRRLCPSRITCSPTNTSCQVLRQCHCSLCHYLHSTQVVVVQYIMNGALFSVLLTRRSCISCSFVASLITNTFSRLVDSCCCCFSFSPVSKSPASSSLDEQNKIIDIKHLQYFQ